MTADLVSLPETSNHPAGALGIRISTFYTQILIVLVVIICVYRVQYGSLINLMSPWVRVQVWLVLSTPESAVDLEGVSQQEVTKHKAPQTKGKALRLSRAEKRELVAQKFSAKKQVYENCRMLSQDGALLCFCDLKKINWYEVMPLPLVCPAHLLENFDERDNL
jgi:hypothetical protein